MENEQKRALSCFFLLHVRHDIDSRLAQQILHMTLTSRQTCRVCVCVCVCKELNVCVSQLLYETPVGTPPVSVLLRGENSGMC